MKKITRTLLWSLAFLPLLVEKTFAVWPPSTMFEDEAVSEAHKNQDTSKMPTPARLRLVIQKLEEDKRQLEIVMQSLIKD